MQTCDTFKYVEISKAEVIVISSCVSAMSGGGINWKTFRGFALSGVTFRGGSRFRSFGFAISTAKPRPGVSVKKQHVFQFHPDKKAQYSIPGRLEIDVIDSRR